MLCHFALLLATCLASVVLATEAPTIRTVLERVETELREGEPLVSDFDRRRLTKIRAALGTADHHAILRAAEAIEDPHDRLEYILDVARLQGRYGRRAEAGQLLKEFLDRVRAVPGTDTHPAMRDGRPQSQITTELRKLRCFELARAAASESHDPAKALAWIELAAGNVTSAALDRILDTLRASDGFYTGVQISIEEGHAADAVPLAKAALANGWRAHRILDLAELAATEGASDVARSLIDLVLIHHPDLGIDSRARIAAIELDIGEPTLAKARLRAAVGAVRTDAGRTQDLSTLITTLVRAGDVALAHEIAHRPSSPYTLTLGLALARAGLAAEALAVANDIPSARARVLVRVAIVRSMAAEGTPHSALRAELRRIADLVPQFEFEEPNGCLTVLTETDYAALRLVEAQCEFGCWTDAMETLRRQFEAEPYGDMPDSLQELFTFQCMIAAQARTGDLARILDWVDTLPESKERVTWLLLAAKEALQPSLVPH